MALTQVTFDFNDSDAEKKAHKKDLAKGTKDSGNSH